MSSKGARIEQHKCFDLVRHFVMVPPCPPTPKVGQFFWGVKLKVSAGPTLEREFYMSFGPQWAPKMGGPNESWGNGNGNYSLSNEDKE